MKILTWNIQSAKGCDDIYDPQRIISVIESFGPVDVICLQEVARNIPVYGNTDQMQIFADHFNEFEVVWGASFSTQYQNAQRSEFGNMTLVRSPLLLDSRSHFLPWPTHQNPQIPRVAVETTIQHGGDVVSIMNTHLAYHNDAERADQMRVLSNLRDQILLRNTGTQLTNQIGAYVQPPASSQVLLCGDLNIALETEDYRNLVDDNNWVDTWALQETFEKNAERTPTCGIYDHVLWPQGPHIRDYFLVSNTHLINEAPGKIKQITVNTETDASDHQPLMLEWLS